MPESVTPTIEIWYQDGGQYRFLHDVEHDSDAEVITKVLDTGILVFYKDPDAHGGYESKGYMLLEDAVEVHGEPDEVV